MHINRNSLPLARSDKNRQGSGRWFVWTLVWVLFFSSLQNSLLAADNSPTDTLPPTASGATIDAAFAPGEVLVGINRASLPSSQAREETLATVGNLPIFAGFSLAGAEVLNITDAPDAPLFLRLRVADGAEMATIGRLQADPSIAFAEPNWIVHAAAISGDDIPTPVLPNDPLFRPYQWDMQRVGAPRAWAIGQGAPIRVAVVDSGIDFNHPEFANRLLAGQNYVTPGEAPQDDSGHGTHVTGIIAAALNNGVGVAGLAPRAIIDPRKVLDSQNGGFVSTIAEAIRDAADSGAKIINLSVTTSANSDVLESAVNYAVGKGVLLVAAAGNEAPKPVAWPAAFPGVLAVAATDRSDQRAYYSNQGAVDLAAPGGLSSQMILSTWPTTGINCSTVAPTNGYCMAFGTSMSAAYVSGVAALVWSMRPELELVQIKNLLLESVYPTGAPSTDLGAGRIDAQKALRLALLSDLQPTPARADALLLTGSPALTKTVTLHNPSAELIFWQAEATSGGEWLKVAPPSAQQQANGSLRYGEPIAVPVVISPTLLASGDYWGSVRLTGNRLNNSSIVLNLPVQISVRDSLHALYLSQIARASLLDWQVADRAGKQPIHLTDNSSTGILLPFTVTLESQIVETVRIYADGFMTFPASDAPVNLPIGCTPESTGPQQAIYGWWSDLNPALGGSVSTFTSTAGGFVVEFFDVPLAGDAAQTVRFQMTFFPNGRVQLNYASLPSKPGDVAVGMEINGGLLSTLIGCRKGTTDLGQLPTAGQTIVIETSDLR